MALRSTLDTRPMVDSEPAVVLLALLALAHRTRFSVKRSGADTAVFVPRLNGHLRERLRVVNGHHWGEPKWWEWRLVIKAVIVCL